MLYNYIMQIIECVVNISEGRDAAKIGRIVDAAQAHAPEVNWLNASSNADANRTVLTFLGAPAAVCNAAFALISAAADAIDMRLQRGAHPRLGATDVCPLVPVQNISLAETAAWAEQLGRKVGRELRIPVYFYAANKPDWSDWKDLSFIRRGEYEGLEQKLQQFPPDCGPADWNEHTQKTGATVIGARPYLIAFNINLSTRDVTIAKEIARQVRASSGGLPAVKAIGWLMKGYGCAQVSCNLTDFDQTPLHVLFETVKKLAAEREVQATGSELIGLIPKRALLQAGRFYAGQPASELTLAQAAIRGLGLNELEDFDARERVLEWKAGLDSPH